MNEIEKLCEDLTNTRVLYVEDEEDVRDMSIDFFQKFFKQIDTATNGYDGLELFKKNKYDLVITDLRMPKMDGREMLKEIKNLNKDVVAIVITASDSDIDASTTACDIYLNKPIEFMPFVEALQSIKDKLIIK